MPVTTSPSESRRVPELRLPYPLIEYLLQLPGDYGKLLLRLLQRAQWVPTVTRDGIALDAGEVLLSLRSRHVWGAVELDRDIDEAGRVSLLRRVLQRLERDGYVTTRATHQFDTPSDTGNGARRDTPATIVRFLKYRDNLWPGNADAARETTRSSTHGTTQENDTIPSNKDPTDPSVPVRESAAVSLQAPPLEGEARLEGPNIGDLRALLAATARAFEEITGVRYQHAQPQAVKADRRAAAELLAATGRSVETVEMVWRWALQQPDWPRIETLADLAQHWGRVAPRVFAARKRAESNPAAGRRVAGLGASCPVWAEIASDLKRRLRPDLFERWFASLNAVVDGEDLRLFAPDEFHRAFLNDNYRAFLEQEMETRAGQGSDGKKLRVRIVTSQSPAAAALKEG